MGIRTTLNDLLNHKSKIKGILPDTEIRRLSQEEDMIVPFYEGVKRQDTISYGLTSFGYDVTPSRTFSIFHNDGLGVLIDPKNFNDSACVTKTAAPGEPIVIPPNGFALTHTVETFNIPKDVVVICVGKSTYARCFSGDTKVALADGTYASFLDLIAMDAAGTTIRGVGLDTISGKVTNPQLISPRKVGTEEVYVMNMERGSPIRVTPDHEFIVKNDDGSFGRVQACNLRPNTNIAQFSYATAETNRITSILPTLQEIDVYCVTSESGNFALESGFFAANCGLIVNVTPIEPGFKGQVVLELSNTTPHPIKVYPDEGISQFMFFRGSQAPEVTYGSKRGKYQNQRGITFPKVD